MLLGQSDGWHDREICAPFMRVWEHSTRLSLASYYPRLRWSQALLSLLPNLRNGAKAELHLSLRAHPKAVSQLSAKSGRSSEGMGDVRLWPGADRLLSAQLEGKRSLNAPASRLAKTGTFDAGGASIIQRGNHGAPLQVSGTTCQEAFACNASDPGRMNIQSDLSPWIDVTRIRR